MKGAHWLLATALFGCARPAAAPGQSPAAASETEEEQQQVEHLQVAVARLLQEPPNTAEARRLLIGLKRPGASRFSGIAQVLLRLLDSQYALRESLERRELEIVDLARRLQATERSLADLHESTQHDLEQTEKLREERARIAKKLEETKLRVAEQTTTIDGLRAELEALKQIDLQRSP